MIRAIVLFAHGARDPRWAQPFEAIAARVRAAAPDCRVALAYLGIRTGGVSLKVFIGIMLGVSFVLLNNVFRHLGLLGNWTPWIVAAAPGAVYLAASLGAFAWLVRFR